MNVLKRFIRFLKQDNKFVEKYCIGINSYIDDIKDQHIIMIDYDDLSKEETIKDIRRLQQIWKLGKADIFSTNNGYHVFFFWDFVPYSFLKLIIETSRADKMYKYISRFYNYKTIRVSGKYKELDIKFVKRIKPRRVEFITDKDWKLGQLKRTEYLNLRRIHPMINPQIQGDE